MADLNKTAARKSLSHVGVVGNASVLHMTWTGDAAQNDIVYMGWVPADSKIFRVTANFTALGASVTADIGYVKMDATDSLTDDADAFTASPADVSAAATVKYEGAPINVTDDVFIVVTLAGANPASGTIDIVIEYNNERK